MRNAPFIAAVFFTIANLIVFLMQHLEKTKASAAVR